MEKKAIQNILSSPFALDGWQNLLTAVFGVKNFFQKPREIPLPSNSKADVACELGSFNTADDRIIGLYLVKLKPEVRLERNKVGLRELLRSVYNYDVDGALIVYEQADKWRLSFVSEIRTFDNERKIIEQKTEPKRYTYLLGKDEKTKTPTDRLFAVAGKKLYLKEILDVFSVEALNKDFYKIVATQFYKLVGATEGKGKKATTYNKVLQLPSVTSDEKKVYQEFAVRLIGRTVFCWFLKKKKSATGKSLLPEHLLSSKAVNENGNYYHSILEKLFFQTLNTPMDKRIDNLPKGCEQIPFLNGGLFEPQNDDYYLPNKFTGESSHINTLKIPDEWFFELFTNLEQYNFTIDENSIVDVEVSVDPEMLGRIFENLLAEIDPDSGESARKATGSYYTPREIVDYMATESLTSYLFTQLQSKNETLTIEQNDLKALFKLDESKDEIAKISKYKTDILNALDNLKILDPACGSGAFPMGMLQKIVMILQKLDPTSEWWKNKQLEKIENVVFRNQVKEKLEHATVEYAQKIGIIQSSLYGVDIQPIAAEISKLRCFLTLIVDENIDDTKPNRGVEPLPNLEFKFVTANTLLQLPQENDFGGLFNSNDNLNELQKVRLAYLQSYGEEKNALKERFLNIQEQTYKEQIKLVGATNLNSKAYKISTWNPFSHEKTDWFDPKWMFGVEKFDVVIGNPPYVQVSKGIYSPMQFPYSEGKDKGKQNLYKVFVEQSYNLAKESGIATMIVQSSLMCDLSSQFTRELLLTKTEIHEILEFPKKAKNKDGQVFENVLQGTCIYRFTKKTPNENRMFKVAIDNDITTLAKPQYEVLKQNEIIKFYPNGYFIPLIKPNEFQIIRKMQTNTFPLKNLIIEQTKGDISQGKDNDHFSINPTPVKLLRGDNVHRYYIDCNAFEFIQNNFKQQIAINNKSKKYLVSQNITGTTDKYRLHFAIDDSNEQVLYADTIVKTLIKDGNECFVLANLNSKLLDWYFRKTSTNNHVNIYELEQLPIKIPENQQPIISLVEQILYLKNSNNSAVSDMVSNEIISNTIEKVIDACVYELYFEDEIKASNTNILSLLQEALSDISQLPVEQQIKQFYMELNDYKNEIRNRIILQETRSESVSTIIKAIEI